MTNLEKFQEVFGITIDDRFVRSLSGQCKILDFIIDSNKEEVCIDSNKEEACAKYATCHECPLYKFWDKEYIEKVKFNCGEVEYIKDYEKATYEWGMKFVEEALDTLKEGKND